MHDRQQYQPDRLAQVQRGVQFRVVQDRGGFADVALEVGGHALGRGGQQGAGVDQHEWVVVHVDDAGSRRDPLRDLVGVLGGGQPGADVEELAEPHLTGEELHGPAQERAVLAGGHPDRGERGGHLVGGLTVGGEVVLAAQPVVVPAGRVRHARVDFAGWSARVGHGTSKTVVPG